MKERQREICDPKRELFNKPYNFRYIDFDHLEVWTNNAFQSAYFYCTYLGFEPYCFRNSYTGEKDFNSFVVRNGDVVMKFISPNKPGNGNHSDFLSKHGDTVRSVGISVDKLGSALDYFKSNDVEISDMSLDSEIKTARIKMFDDFYHTLIERTGTDQFEEGFSPLQTEYDFNAMNRLIGAPKFKRIDHVGFPQSRGDMDKVVERYKKVMGFHHFWSVDDSVIASKYSTLSSTVVSDFDEKIKFPIFEPRPKEKKSQIEEFLEYNGGPGAQHIAIEVGDINHTVTNLRKRGVKFLTVPPSYYDIVFEKMKEFGIKINSDIDQIKENNILIDFDERGYLLQIFTAPVIDRPTLFFEFIERRNNEGFGEGNFQRLFLSIEREQAKRGNLI